MAKGKGARPSAITKLKDAPSDGMRNWLIYGNSGAGKTVLAGTAPNAIFLTVEAAGTESAKKMGSEADEFVVDTMDRLEEAYEFFKYGNGCEEYDWAVIDSLSEVEETLFWPRVQGKNKTKRIQDYGTIATMVKDEVNRWNRLPINVLYTAQTMRLETEDEDGDDVTLTLPSLGTNNGVLSQRICAKTTLNGLLLVDSREDEKGNRLERRRLMLHGSDTFIAKDRHFICPPNRGYLINPNVGEMAAAADASGIVVAGSGSKSKKKKKGK
jgi:phage nucleotide-binding protein